MQVPPHARQQIKEQIKVHSWLHASNSYITGMQKYAVNRRMVRNEHCSHK